MSRVHFCHRQKCLWAFSLLFLAIFFSIGSGGQHQASARELAPRTDDRLITNSVTALLRSKHLSGRSLDDEISRRAFQSFFKSLDPQKLYFNQADIDYFSKYETQIDDMIRAGDTRLGFDIFKLFLERVDQRVQLINTLLDQGFDFTIDENMIVDTKQLNYAKTPEEAADRWRQRLKFDILVLKSDKVTEAEAIEKLRRRYNSFGKRMHTTSADDLLEMYLSSITSSFDPHTSYMSAASLTNFEIQMRLQLDGIGASLAPEDGYTVVMSLIPGGAADKDGRLKTKDRIIGVGQGSDGEILDVVDMNLNEVVQKIRGKKGTVVRLKVLPEGQTEAKTYDIVRASIELKDSEARAEIVESGVKPDGTPFKIGIINLPSFYMDMNAARSGIQDFKSTTRDVERILANFRENHVDAVIMDLRHNGGGSLAESISLTGLFIDRGPVVQVKDSNGSIQQHDDTDSGVAWDGPLVVMVNKFSASASEIFAGAIQDYGRGIVIGDYTTHGKGTVQSLLDIGRELFSLRNPKSYGALKITQQQFYRPNGDSTQSRGVLSDIELPSLTTHYDVGESDLDFAVEFDQIPAARFNKVKNIDSITLDELRRRSKSRVDNSEEFAKVLKKIDRYRQQKDRKSISLQEEVFKAERSDSNEEQEEKELERALNRNRPVIEKDHYYDEAIAITLDYLQLMNLAAVSR